MDLPEEYTIYILNCRCNKYYVGRTKNLISRVEKHLKGEACEFTKIYPILVDNPIYRIIENASAFDEDKYVKIMMTMYGINYVRGGSYLSLTLSFEEKMFLEREIKTATDKCFGCGSVGHYIKKCPNKVPPETNLVTELKKIMTKTDNLKEKATESCERCGRDDHKEKECTATSHLITKEKLLMKCDYCGGYGHSRWNCPQ